MRKFFERILGRAKPGKQMASAFANLKENASVSKTKRLVEIIPEIDAALERGVRHKEILELLNAKGLNLTMATYTNLLFRARRQDRKKTTSNTNPFP